jgi:hypothetical protein
MKEAHSDDIEDFLPREVTTLLGSTNPEEQAKGYFLFRRHAHWLPGSTPTTLRDVTCDQFNISGEEVFTELMDLEPGQIYASQDSLEKDKFPMMDAFIAYVNSRPPDDLEQKFPPIVVWSFFDENLKYIVHDGHHRVHYAYTHGWRINCVVLTPLIRIERVKQALRMAFDIRTLVKDLPIAEDLPYENLKK